MSVEIPCSHAYSLKDFACLWLISRITDSDTAFLNSRKTHKGTREGIYTVLHALTKEDDTKRNVNQQNFARRLCLKFL